MTSLIFHRGISADRRKFMRKVLDLLFIDAEGTYTLKSLTSDGISLALRIGLDLFVGSNGKSWVEVSYWKTLAMRHFNFETASVDASLTCVR